MKREISCPKCVEMWREIQRDPNVDVQSVVLIKDGRARRDMRCDACYAQLAPGAPCHAVSLIVPPDRMLPGWELEFIEVPS